MMKGFVKFSKLMGLMLLASGLLFAGCGQDGSSTDKLVSGHDGFQIPITMDMATQTMDIGNGSGAAVGTWDGHNVELSDISCNQAAPLAVSCSMQVKNLDPDYYMSNVYIALSYCADCTGDKFFSNADISNGVTVFVSGDFDGAGGMADINGAQYCVVEDGTYDISAVPYPEPFNPHGCPTVHTQTRNKPLQFIHPDCGSRNLDWDFSTATGDMFRFYANISADWFPENPLGDARFDFQDKTTYYLTLNTINDDLIPAVANRVWWRIGSVKRSVTLTGYGSGGADYNPTPGSYFALNVQAEYPDRIENETGVGYAPTSSAWSDYEYYSVYAWIIRFDPTVVKNAGDGGVVKGGTTLASGGLDPCDKGAGYCAVEGTPPYTGMEGIASYTNVDMTNGYLYSYNPITQVKFKWNLAGAKYQTTNGATIVGGYNSIFPIAAGQVGLIKVNMVAPATPGFIWYTNTAITHDGPDADPEIPLGMYYFQVRTTAVAGQGTQFYADMWTTEGGPQLALTETGPGLDTDVHGFGAGSLDYLKPCIPFQAGYSAGCDDSIPSSNYTIYRGVEVSNSNILSSGYTVTGAGSSQYWNVHLCVQ